MESLANYYDSEEEQEKQFNSKIRDTQTTTSKYDDKYTNPGSSSSNADSTGGHGRKRPKDDTNYDQIQMELSEDSNDSSETTTTTTTTTMTTETTQSNVRNVATSAAKSNENNSSHDAHHRKYDHNNSKSGHRDAMSSEYDNSKRSSRDNRDDRRRDSHSRDKQKYRDDDRDNSGRRRSDNYRGDRRDDRDNKDRKYRHERSTKDRDVDRDRHRKKHDNDDRRGDYSKRDRNYDRRSGSNSSHRQSNDRHRNTRSRSRSREKQRVRQRTSRSRSRDDRSTIPHNKPISAPAPNAINAPTAVSSSSATSYISKYAIKHNHPQPFVSHAPLSRMERLGQQKADQLKKLGIELVVPPKPLMPTVAPDSIISPLLTSQKYTEQLQKRKLLWGNKKTASKDDDQQPTTTNNKWETAKFSQDTDGKVVSKFLRLMGMKDAPKTVAAADASQQNPDLANKQNEMFSTMEQQYEVARQVTHTMRGMGLGFGTQPRNY